MDAIRTFSSYKAGTDPGMSSSMLPCKPSKKKKLHYVCRADLKFREQHAREGKCKRGSR